MSEVEEVIGEDCVKIIWNIENVSLNTCTVGSSIPSPEFEVKKLRSSDWQIEFYPKGSEFEDYIACYLVPKMYETTFECDKFSLTLSLSVDEIELAKIEDTWISVNSETWKCHQLLKRDSLPDPLPNDRLSICCTIQPESYNDPRRDHYQMESLSENLIGLLESGEHHDLVLVTDSGDRFQVHKCVMSARWPNLLCSYSTTLSSSATYRDCGPEVQVHGITPTAMKTMIRYAYSGEIEANITPEVFKSGVNTDFYTLRKNLTTFPKTYHAVTNFKREHKTVFWHLGDIDSWGSEPPSFIRILPTTELHMYEMILVFSIMRDVDGDQAIDIAFRFSSIFFPTILNCKMSLSVSKGITSPFKSREHLFETNDFWHFPEHFKIRDIPDRKRSVLTMDLTLSDGPTHGIIENSEIDIFGEFAPIRDLHKLSTDMEKLMAESNDSLPTDGALQCINGVHVGIHRALLRARWPQLSAVVGVDADEFKEINVNSSELRDILYYVYTGNSETITTTTAEKLMFINRTIPMPSPMFEMCRSIIAERL